MFGSSRWRRAPPASASVHRCLKRSSSCGCLLSLGCNRRHTRTRETAAAVASAHIAHRGIKRTVLALGRIRLHRVHDVLRQLESPDLDRFPDARIQDAGPILSKRLVKRVARTFFGCWRAAVRVRMHPCSQQPPALRGLHPRWEGRHARVQRHATRMGGSTCTRATSSRRRAASTCAREGSTSARAESSSARVKSSVCKPLSRKPGLTSLHAPVQGRTAGVQSRTPRMQARTPRVRGRTERLQGRHGRVRGHPEVRERSSHALARSKRACATSKPACARSNDAGRDAYCGACSRI